MRRQATGVGLFLAILMGLVAIGQADEVRGALSGSVSGSLGDLMVFYPYAVAMLVVLVAVAFVASVVSRR